VGWSATEPIRLVIATALRKLPDLGGRLTYEHLRSHEDPALWIADAVAWCHGAGKDWRRRVAPLVKEVIDVTGDIHPGH
jgi:hypothetical protein